MAVCCLLTIAATRAVAQDVQQWEEAVYDVMGYDEDTAEGDLEDVMETLSALAQSPLDINSATRKDLEQLPFLTAGQIDDIENYLYHYGPMKSLSELRMISSLDPARLSLLRQFVTVTTRVERPEGLSLRHLGRHSRHQLMGYVQLPFFTRKGDRNGYLGYRYKHWLRYDLSLGNRLKAGLVASQDAGEPFLAGGNSLGYDFYSFFIQLKRQGMVENLVVGKYRLSAGMGLVLQSGFSLGKLALLQSLGRTTTGLRPHSSRSTNGYFQGAATTLRLSRRLSLTAFASYRGLDGTLNSKGEVQTLVTSGYHRTPTEMSKKNNTHATATGLRMDVSLHGLRLGANAVYTHLDRRLQPNSATAYRRYYAQGSNFVNASIDYAFERHRLSLAGETAIDGHGALATLNSLSLRLGGGLSLMALYRFYSYRYQSLYARGVSEGGRVQNESGAMGGISWQLSPRWRLQAYVDYAYSPWLRYQVSQPASHAYDYLLSAAYASTIWSLEGRYRLRQRQRDNVAKTQLTNHREQRARLRLTLRPHHRLTTITQADGILHSFRERSHGYALSQQVAYTLGRLTANLAATYFNTNSYDSRIYLYERAPLYTFSFPSLSGHGLRYSLMLRATIARSLVATARIATTNYFDRTTIGTGYQQSEGSSQTTLDLHLRYVF